MRALEVAQSGRSARGRPTRARTLAKMLGDRLGALRSIEPIGAATRTFLVRTAGVVAVAKHMPDERPASSFAPLLAAATAHGITAPSMLAALPLDDGDGWYALFEYVDGGTPLPGTDCWRHAWNDAFKMLGRLRAIRSLDPPWLGELRWLESDADDEPDVLALRDALLARARPESWTLAHGDFAPQNFVVGPRGLTLIDWEELTYAPDGYDAGWLLSLNRVGAGPRLEHRVLHERLLAMGFDAASLRWSEGLGLLRMYRRASGWAITRGPAFAALRDRVREHIAAFLREGGDADARRRDLR